MNRERPITGGSALAALVILFLLAGCKGEDTPRTAASDRLPLKTVTSDHGLTPYYHGLIEEYRTVLADDPQNLAATIGLANALYDAGQWTDAIGYYDRALRMNPHNADLVTDKGTCYRNIGMIDEAAREYLRALQIDPTHQNALFNLGIVYSQDKKDRAGAARYWRRLLEIAPNHPQADYIRASLENFRRTVRKGAP